MHFFYYVCKINAIDDGLRADPSNTKAMAKRLMNGAKIVSTVTYKSEIEYFLSTMRSLSLAHSFIDDPPYDIEIQVRTDKFTHFCSNTLP